LLERQQKRMPERREPEEQEKNETRGCQSLSQARRRRPEKQHGEANADQQYGDVRGLHDEEEDPRKGVHHHFRHATSGAGKRWWAGNWLEISLVGVSLEIASLDWAPEATQRAPAAPLDENLAAFGYADDVRRAERPRSDVN